MANVTHRGLTGDDIHEPKGADTATANQIYIADGAGSGTWTTVNNTNKIVLTVRITDVSTAGSYWVVSPIAGDISAIYTVINGAIATSDATITTEIAGTAVTGGGITITQSGSAAGDADSATPSAANTVTAGQAIEVITDGASTNTVSADVTIVIDVS